MKITFLGTGSSQGVPVIGCDCEVCVSGDPRDQRLRTSAMVETGGLVIVIDAGPDFRQQMLREGVHKLDAVLLTHGHKDHTGGLDDVRAFNFRQRRPLDLYGNDEVLKVVKHEFSYAFSEDRYPGAPEIELIPVGKEAFYIQEVKIIPIEVMHFHMKVLGFRIGDFTYITDASQVSEESRAKIHGTKILVINALRHKKHYSHFNIEEAVALSREAKAERTFLTHMGHSIGLHELLSSSLPEGIAPAYDGLRVELP